LVGRQCPQVEARRPGNELDVPLGGAVLERQVVLRERTHDVEEEPAWKDDYSLALDRRLGRDPDAELHVGRLQLDIARAGLEPDAGERLDRAARRDTAGGHPEAAYELFAR